MEVIKLKAAGKDIDVKISQSINVKKLKEQAVLLEEAIKSKLGKSKDIDYLMKYKPLWSAINDAKNELIFSPRELGDGLSYFIFESNIQDFKDIAHRLSQFRLLLRGWDIINNDAG